VNIFHDPAPFLFYNGSTRKTVAAAQYRMPTAAPPALYSKR